MYYIIMGFLAFLLYAVYDVNSVTIKNRLLSRFFFLGTLLLMIATVGIVVEALPHIAWNWPWIFIWGMISVFFLILLIYTLFFALPFDETYLNSSTEPKVYTNGFYALCRHPGVLWFVGFYFFLWLTLKSPLVLAAGILFCCCNVIYIIFQDYWTFPRVFSDYPDYKKNTPFLIPNFKSIKRCLQTFK